MQAYRSQCVSSDQPGPMLTALDDLYEQAKADVMRAVDGSTTTRLEVMYRIDTSSLNEDLLPPDESQIERQKLFQAVLWLARQSVPEAQWLLRVYSDHLNSLPE